ncbi:MAG: SURF1 family protein [Novosphingobium sp.]|nr:SURF1 family protein [Novosphingobium sp.]
MKRVPVVATVIVLIAAAIMVALGMWQIQRAHWKDGLIARYQNALSEQDTVALPANPDEREARLYRKVDFSCDKIISRSSIAGRNSDGQAGWAQVALCDTSAGEYAVAMGWSVDPSAQGNWGGGKVIGWLGPAGDGVRVVAMPALGGLQQLAQPDPRDLPNNHMAYAVQWFFFAITALVIYVLALRGRLRVQK